MDGLTNSQYGIPPIKIFESQIIELPDKYHDNTSFTTNMRVGDSLFIYFCKLNYIYSNVSFVSQVLSIRHSSLIVTFIQHDEIILYWLILFMLKYNLKHLGLTIQYIIY